jgi:hypothetical protein
MPKNKRPVPRKSSTPAEPDTDALAQALTDLALEIAEAEDAEAGALAAREDELNTQVRKALRRKHDEVLYGAIELARYTDPAACRYLRARVEEEAATLRVRREGAPEYEIDAFLVPLFVQSVGGLVEAEAFADDDAFDALSASLRQAGLDSADAKVVLIRHAYDLDAIDRIAFSTLHEMLREAAASLTDKKLPPAPTLAASMRPWSERAFGPADTALELRFLLGFSLKRADDPFYRVPADEAAADAYFAARMERYRAWTVAAAPLLARSLAAEPDRLALNFLYQDLFYGAKEQGVAELAMLATLGEVNAALAGRAPGSVRALVAPLDGGEQIVLRVNLYQGDAATPLAGIDKPVDLAADLGAEVDELCDALASLGLAAVDVADGFGADGAPVM